MSSFKVFLWNGEIRRFRLGETTFSSLKNYLCTILSINHNDFNSQYSLTYIDDEQEQISLSNDEELMDAVSLSDGSHVKIYLKKVGHTQEYGGLPPPVYNDVTNSGPISGDESFQQFPPPFHYSDPQTPQNYGSNYTGLPPQFAFLNEFLQFNPLGVPQQNPQQQQQEFFEQRGLRRNLIIAEIQELLFSMLILSARLSSFMIGNRVTLNEQRVRQRYEIEFERALNFLTISYGRLVAFVQRRHLHRLSIRKVFKFMLVLYLAKVIFIPLASFGLGFLGYMIGAFWALSWSLLPFILFLPMAAFFFRLVLF